MGEVDMIMVLSIHKDASTMVETMAERMSSSTPAVEASMNHRTDQYVQDVRGRTQENQFSWVRSQRSVVKLRTNDYPWKVMTSARVRLWKSPLNRRGGGETGEA